MREEGETSRPEFTKKDHSHCMFKIRRRQTTNTFFFFVHLTCCVRFHPYHFSCTLELLLPPRSFLPSLTLISSLPPPSPFYSSSSLTTSSTSSRASPHTPTCASLPVMQFVFHLLSAIKPPPSSLSSIWLLLVFIHFSLLFYSTFSRSIFIPTISPSPS